MDCSRGVVEEKVVSGERREGESGTFAVDFQAKAANEWQNPKP